MKRILFPLLFGLMLIGAAMSSTAVDGAEKKNPVVVAETSEGTIKIEVFADKSPETAKNFLAYVDDKFFDDLLFHRVVPGFVIQGGGFTYGMKEKETKPAIKNEAKKSGLKNSKGTLSMARTNDPDSATSQFFISLKDNAALDPSDTSAGYAVFGKVIEGMDVVEKIGKVETETKKGHQNVPKKDVVIKSIRKAAE